MTVQKRKTDFKKNITEVTNNCITFTSLKFSFYGREADRIKLFVIYLFFS